MTFQKTPLFDPPLNSTAHSSGSHPRKNSPLPGELAPFPAHDKETVHRDKIEGTDSHKVAPSARKGVEKP